MRVGTRLVLLFLLILSMVGADFGARAGDLGVTYTVAQTGGILKVYTNVRNANVYINDEAIGLTPFVRLLPPGRYKVRLELAGYDKYEEEIELLANKAVTINAQLAKVVGSIEVLANVEGARVFLDDKEVGVTPDVVVEDLPAGTYTIQVRRAGYTTYTAPITVKPNVRIKMHVPMVANSARVQISASPAGVTVYLDNENVGVAPLALDAVAAGRHALRFEKSGFATAYRVFQVDVGQKLELSANLSGEGGGLKVKTRVPGADVYLEGNLLGKTPLSIERQVQPGQYSLRITQQGFADHIQPVIIEPGRSTKVNAELVSLDGGAQPLPARGGTQLDEPLTQKWWFWTLVGGAVIAAGGTTAAVVSSSAPPSSTGDVLVSLP